MSYSDFLNFFLVLFLTHRFWLAANLIFAGFYLHQTSQPSKLEKQPENSPAKNAIECLNASLKFSGLLSVDLLSKLLLGNKNGGQKPLAHSQKPSRDAEMRVTLRSLALDFSFIKGSIKGRLSLHFLVEFGSAMIIPDMNSSTAISKLVSPLFSLLWWPTLPFGSIC